MDIQSKRRKAKGKETLAKRLAKERKEKREKEREEKEMSRVTDNPLAALAVERPNAPEIKEGVSLGSLTGNPAATVKPNNPPKSGGPVDWEAVAESNPGQPKKPVVFIPPGSQKAEADKLLPGGEQGQVVNDLFDDIDGNLQAQLDDYAAESPIDIEGDQEADPEALAEADLNQGGMMNVADEEPVEEYAGGITAEFWADRLKAPVQDVRDVMEETELAVLSENPDATPEEIKQAQIEALESDPDLLAHKDTHYGQIDANVERQADQTNRARIMGVPRGMVMMLDQINDAETPDDIVKGLITASSMYPQFRPMVQQVISGQVSANAVKSQLAATMMQLSTERYKADANRPLPPTPDRNPQAIAEDLKNPTFDSQGVQKVAFGLMEGGLEGEAKYNQVALSFAPQMRAVAQQILSDESPIQADLNTAREVIRLAIGDDMPSAAQVNRLFGGGMTGSQVEKVMHLLYGEAGLRNLHTAGNLRGVAKDWGMGDPATWFGFDDLDDVG